MERAQEKSNIAIGVILLAVIIAGAGSLKENTTVKKVPEEDLQAKVLPPNGVILPVRWGNLGFKLIKAGVIDKEKFEALYLQRGGLSKEELALLEDKDNGNLILTQENSGFLLNLFWALGLGNKNNILEKGPMADSKYGDIGNFASTGGWTLSQGNAMDHYSKHEFILLDAQQQKLVEQVSQNIYRPCCNNSTYFPDCNHGMAMLGLLELMASQEIPEEEMYRIALQVNAYWFPDAYLTIAKYLQSQGIPWEKADPKSILSADFSSASGYRKILSLVSPPAIKGGGSCGI